MPKHDVSPLDYASARSKSRGQPTLRQRFAGLFTIAAGLFGLPFLSAGFGYLFRAFRLANRGARDEALFFSAIGFGVGGVCALAAFRWGREWYRRPRGGA
jgi:hypothetical protein